MDGTYVNTRKRAPNFTKEEKNQLVDIVIEKYKDVIENKRTDAVSTKCKEMAWKEIANKFNSRNADVARDWKSFKLCYENIKKRTKKALAKEKAEIHKTGGGSADKKYLDTTQEKVIAALQGQFLPIENEFDNDDNFHPGVVDLDSQRPENAAEHVVAILEEDVEGENSVQVQQEESVFRPSSSTPRNKRDNSLCDVKHEFYTKRLKYMDIEHELKLKNLRLELQIRELELEKLINQ